MITRLQWGLFSGLLLIWMGLLAQRMLLAPDPKHVPLTYPTGQTASGGTHNSGLSTPTLPRTAKTVTFYEPKNVFAGLETMPEKRVVAVAQRPPRSHTTSPAPVSAVQPAIALGPPPPSPEELAEQEARRQQQLAEEARRRQEALIIDEARQRLAQYRFLGYVTQNGEQRAFLAKGKDLYIVSVGELVDGKVHVTRMDNTSVNLTDTTTKLEQRVALPSDVAGSL